MTLASTHGSRLRVGLLLGPCLALLVVTGAHSRRACADEPSATAAIADAVGPTLAKPPDLGDPDAFLVPGAQGNLREWVGVLRGQLERLRTPPSGEASSLQLHTAWQSILQPRIGRMLGRLQTWQDASRWTVTAGETPSTHLEPGQWATFTTSMAMLATELHGAWSQYQHFEIENPGAPRDGPRAMPASGQIILSYPVSSLYRSILDRQLAAGRLGLYRMGSHWRLLERFRTAWDWSWDQSSRWDKYWAQKEAGEKRTAALRAQLQATRDTLMGTLLGLQAFVAAAQDAEEDRLRAICSACRSDDATLREMAEVALRDMGAAVNDAERFQGDSYSTYGSLLRTWLRRERAAASVLDVTTQRLKEEAAEPAAEPPVEVIAPAPQPADVPK